MRPFLFLAFLGLLLLGACERERRDITSAPEVQESRDLIALSTNAPGPGDPVTRVDDERLRYEENAAHLSEGKRLFSSMNCKGCHFNGGGGMGPALIDDKWIYGWRIENIVATIREGRPNGMPSFRGRIPDDQIWELAAYVRSLGGFVGKDAAPSRNDDLNALPSENRLPPASPVTGGAVPTPGERTQ